MCKIGSGFLMAPALMMLSLGAAGAEPSAEAYAAAAERFADCVLEHGRDTHGERHTPLFADGLHAGSFKPVIWKKDGETWVLCNFASQQPLMRLLDGLTAVTGRPKYRAAAEEAAQYAMEHLRTPNGLLHWGGHMAWDLAEDKAVGQYNLSHELKGQQPYYALMHRVAPEETRRLQETIWAGHVLDWALLDYNRHASGAKDARPKWDHAFDTEIAVPFPAQGGNLSFVNVTPPLLHTAVMLDVQHQDADALRWANRLVDRWIQARHPETGLSGGQLSYREHDRAQDALGHVHPGINEAKIVASYHQTCRYHTLPLAQMQAGLELRAAGGALEKAGKKFIDEAANDLEIYARQCFDPKTKRFAAMTTDGEPLKWEAAKTDYYTPASFKPRPADGDLFWGFCMAWRLTGDQKHWEMAREIAAQFGLGDLGATPEDRRSLNLGTNHADWRGIYALLELYEGTRDKELLRLAARAGDNLLKRQHASGLFPGNRGYARTGDEAPLALLHLAAALSGKRAELPPAKYDSRFFHAEFHGDLDADQQKRADKRTYDNYVYYRD